MTNPIKKILHSLGLDVRLVRNVRKNEISSWEKKQGEMWRPFVSHLNIRTVIDVGANTGQFAELIHRLCPDARIISVEPLESCHADLSAVLKKILGSSIIKAGVGESPGHLVMNVSAFTPCSSLLRGTELLGEDYPSAADTKEIEVPIVRLDDAVTLSDVEDDLLIKLDVQGYELQAIKGAEQLLMRAKIVVCEVCFFRRLYEGQPLFEDIHTELRKRGFTYMGNAEQAARKVDGRIVEADAIFERLH